VSFPVPKKGEAHLSVDGKEFVSAGQDELTVDHIDSSSVAYARETITPECIHRHARSDAKTRTGCVRVRLRFVTGLHVGQDLVKLSVTMQGQDALELVSPPITYAKFPRIQATSESQVKMISWINHPLDSLFLAGPGDSIKRKPAPVLHVRASHGLAAHCG